MRFSDLPGRRVAVWGFGREGRAVADRCHALGVDVVVALPDSPGPDADGEPTAYPLLHGAEGLAALRGADVVVKSPGIPVASDTYRSLVDAGVAITSLMDLWLSEHAHRAIAVTGTKGKSTTASAIAHVLTALGQDTTLLGNIGRNVLEDTGGADDVAVVEVSSYQAQSLSVSPRVAVVTSLFPEHVPWHGSVEAYFDDKLRLVDHDPEAVVLPEADTRLVGLVREHVGPATRLVLSGPATVHADESGAVVWPGVGSVPAGDLRLRGRHNAANLALALLAVEAWGLLPDNATRARALDALRSFAPLEHRMEVLPSSDGRTWVDDSLATAPEAVVAALRAWPDEGLALIVGGAERDLDLRPLVDGLLARGPATSLLLTGPTGARLERDFGPELAGRDGLDVRLFERFADAVGWALSPENPHATVLFSPGAPSFDEFTDYVARSEALRRQVAPTP
ncbi:MAG: UDP-N-acetylmuramoyl-L-alanine--D-glutamate ligase [Nocardioides sp.]